MTVLPLKRLGQNFLVDERVKDRIIESCNLAAYEDVLEIGPGSGVLTKSILPLVRSLAAVESDGRLLESLNQEFSNKAVKFYNEDILKFNFTDLIIAGKIKVVGNIPYYISTPIIEKLITERQYISSAFLTVQYEFGMRLTAKLGTKDYSALTCLINYFAKPRVLFRIGAGSFRPIPKVASCFMSIDFNRDTSEIAIDEVFFISLVKKSFLHRRKKMINSLMSFIAKDKLLIAFEKAGINDDYRPEDVTVEGYVRLANSLCEGA